MANIYELIGGPLDGEWVACDAPIYRIPGNFSGPVLGPNAPKPSDPVEVHDGEYARDIERERSGCLVWQGWR